MVKIKMIWAFADNNKADEVSLEQNFPGIGGRKAGQETLFCPVRIKPSGSLQAVLHCLDTQVCQRFAIRGARRNEGYGVCFTRHQKRNRKVESKDQ